MSTYTIAVPSSLPGGLEAGVNAHFGHCDIYTLIDVNEGQIGEVRTLENVPHEQGGCMAPVNHLAGNGVKVLIAGGMGMRPLQGFHQVGIDVFYGGQANTVNEALLGFLAGQLQPFTMNQTCGGGTDHSHDGGCGNHI